tara:strand:- start:660 stop:1352 length:693 start_codon:yes stop_codon:yes gene_type:complete
MKIGKRLKESYKSFENSKLFSIEEAVKLVKSNSNAKFDETIDIAMNLGVDPRQSDQMVRGMVALPSGTGKEVKVAVFAKNEKLKEATEAGADFIGEADLAEKIETGKIDFDRVIATPDLMGTVGKLGKILGPRGLMPNPKLGTVTMDVAKAVKAAKSGEVQFRVEKSGIVHARIGKSSFDEKSIIANINAFIKAVSKAKPSSSKGVYMKRITISSTMGPGVKIDTVGVVV